MIPANHQRYLLSRFRHIEEMLGEAIGALHPADDGRLFRRVVPDATATQRKVLADHLALVRFALRRFMEAQQIQDPTRPVSGLWSVRTAVLFARTAVTECGPQYMRGYGELDAEATAAALRLVAELTALLDRLVSFLEKGEQAELADRLARLDATREEIPLLRELERITTAHGLLELRPALETLVERAASPRYEIAVFGRVSSGKSSLLNWWLGQPVLPVGVTPVTAVPTRIVHGATAKARVRTVTGSAEIPLEQLAAYVTEAGNPGNTRGVLEVLVEYPGERLAQGICLVDTPGVGSLASAGAAQTWDYLPRCDLGIQLIEAGTAVTREDLDLARAVLDSGSDHVLALSKADRLTQADLADALAYVSGQLQAALGMPVSAHPISTLPAALSPVARWFEQVLAPKLEQHRQQSATLLRRKVGTLREAVMAALSARLSCAPDSPQGAQAAPAQALAEDLARQRAALLETHAQLLQLTGRIHSRADLLTQRAAEALARCWQEGDRHAVRERIETAVAARAAALGDLIADLLKSARERLQGALPQPADARPELALPRGRPLFDVSALPGLAHDQPPWWAPPIRRLLRALARERVENGIGPAAAAQLSVYADALRLWGTRYLDELTRQFDDAWASQEGMIRLRAGSPPPPAAAGALRADLDLLRDWPRSPAQRTTAAS